MPKTNTQNFKNMIKATFYLGLTGVLFGIIGGCVAYKTIIRSNPRETEARQLLAQWTNQLVNETSDAAKLEMANAIGIANARPSAPYPSLAEALRDDGLRQAMLNRTPSWFAFAGFNLDVNQELHEFVTLGGGTAESALHIQEGIDYLHVRLIQLKKVLAQRGPIEIEESPYPILLRRLSEGNPPFHHLDIHLSETSRPQTPFFTENDVLKYSAVRDFLDGIRRETRATVAHSTDSFPDLLRVMQQAPTEFVRGVGQNDFLLFIRRGPGRLLPPSEIENLNSTR